MCFSDPQSKADDPAGPPVRLASIPQQHQRNVRTSQSQDSNRHSMRETNDMGGTFRPVAQQTPYQRPARWGHMGDEIPNDAFGSFERQLRPMIDPIPFGQPLCQFCFSINLELLAEGEGRKLHYPTFDKLERSAPTCPMCALLYNSIQKRGAFSAFAKSPVWLMSDFGGMKAVFNCVDPERAMRESGQHTVGRSYMTDEPGLDGILRVDGKYLELLADPDSRIAESGPIHGRTIKAAHEMFRPRQWISECELNHDECQASRQEHAYDPSPKRLLDMWSPNQSNPYLIRLSEDHDELVEYLTLSYRWPTNVSVCTTRATLARHLCGIDPGILSKTIKDAIWVTRELGFRYPWVDSLCIVQDDQEDWAREAAQMANIYQRSTLTLSASASTSNDEGLLLPRVPTNDVKLPFRSHGGQESSDFCYVSDRFWKGREGNEVGPSTFDQDVMHGSLSSRGWCLQERALAPRILHFGKEQLHWECLRGYVSETRESTSDTHRTDAAGRLRSMVLSGYTFREKPPVAEEIPHIEVPREFAGMGLESVLVAMTGSRKRFGREPYASWYALIEQYTRRQLTNEGDKLPALSGIARAFARYAEDTYVAGIWVRDLLSGLLWCNPNREQHLRLPEETRVPTWSWVFYDGAVEWPAWHDIVGAPDFKDGAAFRTPETSDEFGKVAIAFMKVTGRVQPMRGIKGFNAEFLDWLRVNEDNLDYDCRPDPQFDQEVLPTSMLHVLLLAPVACHPNCRHAVGCDKDGMGFALMLVCHEGENQYTHTGAARPGCVYNRAGLARVFRSSFAHVPHTEILLI